MKDHESKEAQKGITADDDHTEENNNVDDPFCGKTVQAKTPGSVLEFAVLAYGTALLGAVLVISPAVRRRKKELKRRKRQEKNALGANNNHSTIPLEIEIQTPYILYKEMRRISKETVTTIKRTSRGISERWRNDFINDHEALSLDGLNSNTDENDNDPTENQEILSFFAFFSNMMDPSGLFVNLEFEEVELFDIGSGKRNARRNESFIQLVAPTLPNSFQQQRRPKRGEVKSNLYSEDSTCVTSAAGIVSSESSDDDDDDDFDIFDDNDSNEDPTDVDSVSSWSFKSLACNPNVQNIIIPSSVRETHKNITSLNENVIKKARKMIVQAIPSTLGLIMQRNDTSSLGADDSTHGLESSTPTSHRQPDRPVQRRLFKPVKRLLEVELEVRRVLKLAVPLTVGDIFDAGLSLFFISLVSNFLGVEDMAAYTMALFVLDLSMLFSGGISDALYNVTTHSLGAQNYELAGQYLQLSLIYSLVFALLAYCILYNFVGHIMIAFQFSEDTASRAQSFVRVQGLAEILNCIHDNFVVFLDVIGHARFNTAMQIIRGTLSFSFTAFLVVVCGVTDLNHLGITNLAFSWTFLCFHIVWPSIRSWLDPYIHGLTMTWGFKKKENSWILMRNGLTLSLGHALADFEWKFLTIIASHNGAMEVSAVLIIGKIWKIVEAVTSGLAEAADLRVAYHLGHGNIGVAKISAYMCLLFGCIVACGSFIFLMNHSDVLLQFLTTDEDLQQAIGENLPLMGIGAFVMVFARLASSLISAQGRCREATLISVMCSYLITLPIAEILVMHYNFDLQAIVSAVVFGRATFAAIMLHFMILSNWKKLSKLIRQKASAGKNQAVEVSHQKPSPVMDEATAASTSTAEHSSRLV